MKKVFGYILIAFAVMMLFGALESKEAAAYAGVLLFGVAGWLLIKSANDDDNKSASSAAVTEPSPQPGLHLSIQDPNTTKPYSAFLNQCEHLTYLIADRYPSLVLHIFIEIEQIHEKYCSLCFQLEDFNYSDLGVTFGEEFTAVNDSCVKFYTVLGSDFSTPENAKKEILLQFHWDDLPVTVSESTVSEEGSLGSPAVSCRLVVGPKRML